MELQQTIGGLVVSLIEENGPGASQVGHIQYVLSVRCGSLCGWFWACVLVHWGRGLIPTSDALVAIPFVKGLASLGPNCTLPSILQ